MAQSDIAMAEIKENLTPLMQQYEELKSEHLDEILFFRLGDFYEMFGSDAKIAAPILEVALTQRQGAPMCGIPYHAVDRYIPKLLKQGLRVAIAEQMEDPSLSKGIVKRAVVRIISAGTVIEEKLLNEKSNNFLVAVALSKTGRKIKGNEKEEVFALAALDISTGQLTVMEAEHGHHFAVLRSEISRINPAEIVLCEGENNPTEFLNGIPLHFLERADFDAIDLEKFFPQMMRSQKLTLLKTHAASLSALRMALCYIQKMNPALIQNIQLPDWTNHSEMMTLDKETIENLEILKNSFDGTAEKSLLKFLDRTLTPMGGRLLKQWLVRPLIRIQKIKLRLESVDFFVQESSLRKNIREKLKGISDLERMIVRLSSSQKNPRDLIGLKLSLLKARELKKMLGERTFSNLPLPPLPETLNELLAQIPDWDDLIALIEKAIADDPPIGLDDGGVIRAGYDALLDEKRRACEEGRSWLEDLEKREKQKSQIPTLKIGYTSVFGYYLEVTKPHLAKVPANWHRKQTLINAERFVNEELKQLEQKILGAEEQCLRMERQLFQAIAESVKKRTQEIQKTASAVATLDCFLSLSEVAELKSLSKPEMDESETLVIEEGWHPVVKEFLPPGSFVPNDTELDGGENQIVILTGPNMSGKSTYLRQVALIVFMAQIGSFVSAKAARIGVVDRIFTRIGSGDRLAQGESTFMVEMQETAKILNCASSKSLIILDEVGRGTSTYDGISIAWSVIEYLAGSKQIDSSKKRVASSEDKSAVDHSLLATRYLLIRPKVLFATHYFELTHLASEIEGVKNYNVQAKEWQDSVLFLHKIAPGPADRSYGIHVAQLAGLPSEVIQRAKKILNQLEQEHLSVLKSKTKTQQQELSTFHFNHDRA